MMRIDGIIGAGANPVAPPTPGVGKTSSFSDLLRDSIGETNRMQLKVEDLSTRAFSGEDLDPAIVANAVNKADIAFRTMIQVRTKLIDAFNELRNLQI
ncbi:MAG: flagellar hook-basal body complex protein FliE [Planctomycetota bacterium]